VDDGSWQHAKDLADAVQNTADVAMTPSKDYSNLVDKDGNPMPYKWVKGKFVAITSGVSGSYVFGAAGAVLTGLIAANPEFWPLLILGEYTDLATFGVASLAGYTAHTLTEKGLEELVNGGTYRTPEEWAIINSISNQAPPAVFTGHPGSPVFVPGREGVPLDTPISRNVKPRPDKGEGVSYNSTQYKGSKLGDSVEKKSSKKKKDKSFTTPKKRKNADDLLIQEPGISPLDEKRAWNYEMAERRRQHRVLERNRRNYDWENHPEDDDFPTATDWDGVIEPISPTANRRPRFVPPQAPMEVEVEAQAAGDAAANAVYWAARKMRRRRYRRQLVYRGSRQSLNSQYSIPAAKKYWKGKKVTWVDNPLRWRPPVKVRYPKWKRPLTNKVNFRKKRRFTTKVFDPRRFRDYR